MKSNLVHKPCPSSNKHRSLPSDLLNTLHLSNSQSMSVNIINMISPFSDYQIKCRTFLLRNKYFGSPGKYLPLPKFISKNLGSLISPIRSLAKLKPASIYRFCLVPANITQYIADSPVKVVNPNKVKCLSWFDVIFLGTESFACKNLALPQ